VEPKVKAQTLGNITLLALAVAREELLQIVLGIYLPRHITPPPPPPLKATNSLVLVVLVGRPTLPLTTMLSMVVEAEVVVDMEMVPQA
jgi:hypothetical protein